MNTMEVRKAELKDMKALAFVQIQSWRKAFFDILSEETLKKYTDIDQIASMLESVYSSGRGTFYIATYNGTPCGELFWCNAQDEMLGYAEIVAVHSLEEVWGKGIGKAMMDKAIADIKSTGIKHIFLWVFRDNKRARKFYEKCGFTADGTEQISRFDEAVEVRYVM